MRLEKPELDLVYHNSLSCMLHYAAYICCSGTVASTRVSDPPDSSGSQEQLPLLQADYNYKCSNTHYSPGFFSSIDCGVNLINELCFFEVLALGLTVTLF